MSNEQENGVLFVCTGNAGRSQIAEALFHHQAPDTRVMSAGVAPWENLHPSAVALLTEHGYDCSGQFPKSAMSLAHERFAIVVTIGEPARMQLPTELRTHGQQIHWDIDDPADADNTPESDAVFRRTYEAIAERLAAAPW